MVLYRDDWESPTKVSYNDVGGFMSRLRADPELVRLSIRPYYPNRWLVQVKCRKTAMLCWCIGEDPKVAVQQALVEAQKVGIKGVDLPMDLVYSHPWGQLHYYNQQKTKLV